MAQEMPFAAEDPVFTRRTVSCWAFPGQLGQKKVNLNFLGLQEPSQFGVLQLSHGHGSFSTAKWA